MRVWQKPQQRELKKTMKFATSEGQGLASWVLNLLRGWRSQCEAQRKELRLVETLPLGGKRQLMLVTCAGESFLVGGGSESVETIVRLESNVAAKNLDVQCQ